LEVLNGEGSGDFPQGAEVSIKPTVPAGFAFVRWFKQDGDGNLKKPFMAQTTYVMGKKGAQVAAVFARIESWFPPGPEDGKEGILLAKNPMGDSPRLEQKIRVIIDYGEADSELVVTCIE
jgi:hypothetical protein